MHARRKAGFTLIEILIVIMILGLLVSLVAPTMFSKVSSSQRQAAMAQMQMIATALDAYRLDMGEYPESLEDLRRSDRRGWDGPYLPRALPLDPWDNPYQYQRPGEDGAPYALWSFGRDGRAGGEGEDADVVFQ